MNNDILINIAYINKERAITAIKNSDYASNNDFLYIVENNDIELFSHVENAGALIDILKNEFNDIDTTNILYILATSITRSMNQNNEALKMITNYDARKALDGENIILHRLNNVLCDYAQHYENISK